MGSFIGSYADNEICDVLNTRFSDQTNPHDSPQHRTYIKQLRDHVQNREKLFDGNHHLHRVFHRLATSVTRGPRIPTDSTSRHRWLFLLRSTKMPTDTKKAIKEVLSAVLIPTSNIAYVTFLTRHVPTISKSFELYPQNSGTPDVYVDANQKIYCQMVLECHDDAPLTDSPNETDPPAADGNEKQISAVRRSKKSAKKSSAKKSSARKKSRKKTRAKKTKA